MILSAQRLPSLRPALRAVAAAGCVALVLLLSVLSTSPATHEQVHHDCEHQNYTCAVVLFAHGISLALSAIEVPAPTLAWHEPVLPAAQELFLTAPRYLRQPERGPPTG